MPRGDALGGRTEASEDRAAPIYRYNRAERLARAPETLKKVYADRAAGKKRGFFALLRENPGLLILFATIILFIILAYVLPLVSKLASSSVAADWIVAGRAASLSAALENGRVLGALRLEAPAQEGEPEQIALRASLDGKSAVERIFVTTGRKETETFLFGLEADSGNRLDCVIEARGSLTALSAPVVGR